MNLALIADGGRADKGNSEMLVTILISLLIGFTAAIALGVSATSIIAGIRRGREIRRELAVLDGKHANRPYEPQRVRPMWASA